MARDNKNMHKAKSEKNDEFYTLLTDIEKEMKYYKNQFRDKVVYCNCDDARESNFFKYFSMNFEHLGLKKLITTSFNANGKGTILIYEGDKNGNKKVDDEEIIVEELNGNGDFRSEECLELLAEADIVVTNPPFSLFREYINVLMNFNKKFCVIASKNVISYKDFFPYLKNGQIWLGKKNMSGSMWFSTPEGYENKNDKIINGVKSTPIACCWFTNMENNKYVDIPTLLNKYNEKNYPKFDNYNAINCNKTTEIPYDYDGVIGVPITALNYLCSDGLLHFDTPMRERENIIQNSNNEHNEWSECKLLDDDKWKTEICEGVHSIYKLVGAMTTTKVSDDNFGYPYINGKKIYARVLIKRVN